MERVKIYQDAGGNMTVTLGPTEAALRAYQRDRGLRVTRNLDPPTFRSLTSEPRTAAPSAPSAAPTLDVRAAQRELKNRGYYSGPVDAVIGAHTETALRAYQRDRGLSVTGRLDAPAVRSLTS